MACPLRFALVILAAALPAARCFALEGEVVDASGQPLAGARLAVVGRTITAVADQQGRFAMHPDPQPPFELLVSLPGGTAFGPIAVSELPAAGPLRVRLAFTDAVTVVSGAVPDLELPPAAALTLMGSADLTLRRPARLVDVLEAVPGAGRSDDSHAAVPSLRGMARGRTLLLLDGGRVTAERRAGPSATFLDPETLEEVEVVRGPGTVAYGSDAFGGIIRARSRLPRPGDPPSLRLACAAGTGIDERGCQAEASAPLGGGALLVGGQARSFDDYESPHGTVPISGGRDLGLRLAYQSAVLGGALTVVWRTDQARDVGKPATDSATTRTTYPEERSHRLSLGFERPGPGSWSSLAATAFWDSTSLVTSQDRLATAAVPRQLTEAEVAANDYGVRLEAERPLAGGRLLLGVDTSGRVRLSATNDTTKYDTSGMPSGTQREVSIEDADRSDFAVFASLNRHYRSWGLAGGLRADLVRAANHGGYFGSRSTSNGSLSGFLATTVAPRPGLELSLQVARGFRDALLSDRFYRGISGRGFITGNPDLEPETSRHLDLSVRRSLPGGSLAAFAYLCRISDLIERYRSGADYAFRNRGEVEVRGLELEGRLDVGASLHVEVGAQAQRGEVLDDGTPAADVPPWGAFVTLRREGDGRTWWYLRWAAFLEDDRPGAAELARPGYSLFSGGLGIRLREGLEAQLIGRNLTDRAYVGSGDERAVLAPGRSLQLRLAWSS